MATKDQKRLLRLIVERSAEFEDNEFQSLGDMVFCIDETLFDDLEFNLVCLLGDPETPEGERDSGYYMGHVRAAFDAVFKKHVVAREAVSAKPEPWTGESLVYLVGCEETQWVKIGTTTNLERRLQTLQTGSPAVLSILWTHPGSYAEERRLHAHFAAQRRAGEWFDLGSDPVSAVKAAMPKATKTPIRELMAW